MESQIIVATHLNIAWLFCSTDPYFFFTEINQISAPPWQSPWDHLRYYSMQFSIQWIVIFALTVAYSIFTMIYLSMRWDKECVTNNEVFSAEYYSEDEKQSQFCTKEVSSNLSSPLPDFASDCEQTMPFDCAKVLAGDKDSVALAKHWTIPSSWKITPLHVLNNAKVSCRALLAWLRLPAKALSKEELDFPLAFVFLTHSNFNQFIRLLRMLYMPQNAYCIHVDRKCTSDYRAAVQMLVQCVPNVIVAERSRDIAWCSDGYLRSTDTCLSQLNDLMSHRWQYVQILTDTDMPLRTNREMVEALKIFSGANDVELLSLRQHRADFAWHIEHTFAPIRLHKKPPAPYAIRPYKGSIAATLSRDFVNFSLKDQRARDFFDWSRDTLCPEEMFWTSLNHNVILGAPGNYPGYYVNCSSRKTSLSRYQLWELTEWQTDINDTCLGTWARGSCVFGIGDLPAMMTQQKFVAHKFQEDVEPAAQYCLAALHCHKTFHFCDRYRHKYDGAQSPLNRTFIEHLSSVSYHKLHDKSGFQCNQG